MTIVVTRNVKDRFRGFLSSTMLELAPGVYSSPRISPSVRERIWEVMSEWYFDEENATVIMLWSDNKVPGGQSVRVLGVPPIDLVEIDGMVLSCRRLKPNDM
jgi:CRISPR-associated protein Cas2